MNLWMVLLVGFNLFSIAGLGVAYLRLKEKRRTDPRLSYGLKLLESKISVLEDLSDRTDQQVRKLVHVLDLKMKDLKNSVNHSDDQLESIKAAMAKTLEVAEIFQAQLPHHEIIERQTDNMVIQAARMSKAGKSVQEISQAIDLPEAQIELIQKMNHEEMLYNESELPHWVEKPDEDLFKAPEVDMASLEALGIEFKKACLDFEESHGITNTVEPYQFKRSDVNYD